MCSGMWACRDLAGCDFGTGAEMPVRQKVGATSKRPEFGLVSYPEERRRVAGIFRSISCFRMGGGNSNEES